MQMLLFHLLRQENQKPHALEKAFVDWEQEIAKRGPLAPTNPEFLRFVRARADVSEAITAALVTFADRIGDPRRFEHGNGKALS